MRAQRFGAAQGNSRYRARREQSQGGGGLRPNEDHVGRRALFDAFAAPFTFQFDRRTRRSPIVRRTERRASTLTKTRTERGHTRQSTERSGAGDAMQREVAWARVLSTTPDWVSPSTHYSSQ